jgi:hypothetical protein
MSLFGKLLAILNVVAAIAFVYLAALDLARGTPWRNAVMLHEKQLAGSPVAKPDVDADREGEVLDEVFAPARDSLAQAVENAPGDDTAKHHVLEHTLLAWARPKERDKVEANLSATRSVPPAKLAKDLRAPLDKSDEMASIRPLIVVATQQEEVQRWHDYLLDDIKRRDGEAAKRARLAEVLVPLFDTASERAEMARRIQSEPLDRLLSGPFEDAFPKPVAAGEDELAYPESKEGGGRHSRDIAHLLVTLSQLRTTDGQLQDPAAPARTQVVIGLRAYNRELGRQAQRLREVAQEMRAAMYLGKYSDRAQFIAQHQEIVQQLRQLAVQLEEANAVLAQQKEAVQKVEEQVRARKAVVDEFTAGLNKVTAEKKKKLAEQSQQERELFDAQRALVEATNENARLERELRRLEGLK